jgi:hypothetical protein
MANTPQKLASEDVIINAPLSYAGSAQRIFRLRRGATSPAANAAITTVAVLLIIAAWAFVTCWYFVWGLWLVPYRLLRRGSRKRKAEALRHREMLGAISTQPPQTATATMAAPILEPGPGAAALSAGTGALVMEATAEPSTEASA